MCSAVVPQQPPTMLTRPLLGEFAHQRRGLAGLLVVFAERIGQAGIRIGAHRDIGDARELLDVGTQLLGAERAVQPDHRRRA